VRGTCVASGREVVAVTIQLVVSAEAQADSAIATTRRLNKTYFLIVEKLKRLTVGIREAPCRRFPLGGKGTRHVAWAGQENAALTEPAQAM